MKGIVFTGLLDMLEEAHGYEFVDELIRDSSVPSNGVYTSIGTYDFSEMQMLLTTLSKKTNLDIASLLYEYGKYFSQILSTNYKHFFDAADNLFDFLGSIDQYIHVEVQKLYPDAELPEFEAKKESDKRLHLIYTSTRNMGSFALGLIEKAAEYFEEPVNIAMKELEEGGGKVEFIIEKL